MFTPYLNYQSPVISSIYQSFVKIIFYYYFSTIGPQLLIKCYKGTLDASISIIILLNNSKHSCYMYWRSKFSNVPEELCISSFEQQFDEPQFLWPVHANVQWHACIQFDPWHTPLDSMSAYVQHAKREILPFSVPQPILVSPLERVQHYRIQIIKNTRSRRQKFKTSGIRY